MAPSVWPRTAPGGRPAVYRSRDGGKTWKRQDQGLPKSQAWWTVKRQAMTADARDPTGVYFGTTSGEVWASRDEGRSFRCLARHLPQIYAGRGRGRPRLRCGRTSADARRTALTVARCRARRTVPRRESHTFAAALLHRRGRSRRRRAGARPGTAADGRRRARRARPQLPGHPVSNHRRAGQGAAARQAVRGSRTRRATCASTIPSGATLMIVAALVRRLTIAASHSGKRATRAAHRATRARAALQHFVAAGARKRLKSRTLRGGSRKASSCGALRPS